MELSEAINVVKGYLPMLPNLGERGNEAIALVMLGAMAYEESTWHYQYEVEDAAGTKFWVSGFPAGMEARQRRYRGEGEEMEYGNWRSLRVNPNIRPQATE